MNGLTAFRGLDRTSQWRLIGGFVLLAAALDSRSVPLILVALALLFRPARAVAAALRSTASDQPWPWPADFRSLAEGLARPIDPTPKRLVPPDDKAALIAQVAATKEGLSRLIADKPPAWPWAVFASVLVQRRNAVGDRLRRCASGYQPRPGIAPLTGRAYAQTAIAAMDSVADLVKETEQFMLSSRPLQMHDMLLVPQRMMHSRVRSLQQRQRQIESQHAQPTRPQSLLFQHFLQSQ